jgi:hypothetical protein
VLGSLKIPNSPLPDIHAPSRAGGGTFVMMLFMVSDSGEPSIRPVAAAIVNAIFDASDIDGAYWPVPEEIDDAELPDVLD